MRIINTRGMIQSIMSRLRSNNAKKSVIEMIEKLNLDFATEEEIYAITGNKKWTRIVCGECDKEVDSVVVLFETFDADLDTITAFDWAKITAGALANTYICRDCLLSASLLFLGDQPHAKLSSGGDHASAV